MTIIAECRSLLRSTCSLLTPHSNASKKYVRQLEERVETLESLVNMVGAYEPADGFARGTSQELTTASAMVTEPTLVIGASPMTSASNHDVAFVQGKRTPFFPPYFLLTNNRTHASSHRTRKSSK